MGSVTRLIVIALIVVHFEVIHNGPRSLVRSGKHATARLHGMLNRRRGQVLSWTDRAARELARQLLRGGTGDAIDSEWQACSNLSPRSIRHSGQRLSGSCEQLSAP